MKPGRFLKPILILMIFSLAATSCSMPSTPDPGFEVHLGRPVNGDVIMVGESMQLIANGSSTGGDVSSVTFYANETSLGDATNRYGGEIVAEMTWRPTAAGEYALRAIAHRATDTATSETVTVCVLPFQIAPGHPFDIYAHGYTGECAIPARASWAAGGAPTITHAGSDTSMLTYVPHFMTACTDRSRVLSFKVYIDDPNDDVVFAAISFKIMPAYAGRSNSETTLVLSNPATTRTPSKGFFGSIDLYIYMARSLVEPGDIPHSGEVEWTARAFGRDGSIVATAGPFIIPVEPVGCDGTPIAPAALIAAATATPGSDADCPPGTYFAPVTHRCIAIQIKPAGGGDGDEGGGTSGCQPPPDGCGDLNWYGEPFCFCFE